MRKLIKRYLSGGDFAQDKSLYYPGTTSNTGNIGAIDLATLTGGKTPSFAPGIDRLMNLKPNIPNIPIDTAIGKGLFGKLGSFGKNLVGNLKSMGPGVISSMGSNILSSLLPEATQSKGLQGINTVLGLAENIPVYGKFASLAKLGINALNSLGGHTIATLNNGLEEQDTLANTGGGYGDFMADWDEAKQYSGKRAGLFDGNKYDEMVWDANYNMSKLLGIIGQLKINNTLTALMADRWNEHTMMDMNGGPGNIMFGRLGLKVEILPKVHAILNTPKVVDFLTEFKEEVPEFKEGGKMNVIPEGSLHARLHHMENAEGLTKKGIPVVSIAEGGEIELQAEIELNEIIFNLEVTTELEKLMNDGSDNAAIEAGKLLVKEIFENTDDRTGLIKDLEPEKKESTTEDIVKNHQVFLQGGNLPTLKTIEELVEEAIKLNPTFVQRIGPNMGYAEFIDKNGKKARGTHYLESVTDDRGNTLVYPRIQIKEGQLKDLGDKAWEEAKRNKNYLVFNNPKDAELFATKYKESKLWKPFFDVWEQRYGSYKHGGIIEQIEKLSPDKLEELLKIIKYLNQ